MKTQMLMPWQVNGTRLAHFSAALRTSLYGLWNEDASLFRLERARGVTAVELAMSYIKVVSGGRIRALGRNDPVLRATCKALVLPYTYRAIEDYLRKYV